MLSLHLYGAPCAATPAQARAAIALYFRNNGHLKDPRVVDALVMKGYMDLEETTMQVRNFVIFVWTMGTGVETYP